MGKICKDCGADRGPKDYSKTQWKKRSTEGRCQICTGPAGSPARGQTRRPAKGFGQTPEAAAGRAGGEGASEPPPPAFGSVRDNINVYEASKEEEGAGDTGGDAGAAGAGDDWPALGGPGQRVKKLQLTPAPSLALTPNRVTVNNPLSFATNAGDEDDGAMSSDRAGGIGGDTGGDAQGTGQSALNTNTMLQTLAAATAATAATGDAGDAGDAGGGDDEYDEFDTDEYVEERKRERERARARARACGKRDRTAGESRE
jgi:hypothetical protein